MHDVQDFWFLSGTFTLLTNLTWFVPTYLHFSRLCFDQLCTRSAHDDKKRRVLKIHRVRLKMKHSSSWLSYRTKWGQKERGDTSGGRTIKRSVSHLYSMRPPVFLPCPKSPQKLRPAQLLVSAENEHSEPHNSNVTQWVLLHSLCGSAPPHAVWFGHCAR